MSFEQPLTLLPGQGKLAKPVTDCTELSLAGRGIEELCGFERLVNLEVLWLQHNKLRQLSNLDQNVRLKQLYVHNNSLCTLKGSLQKLRFLTHLDISNNGLKGLDKVLNTLQKLHFLQDLNMQGNPCCEEPQYRLQVLAALPSLKVLDHHEVSTQEQQQAARLTTSGDVRAQKVAFGSHIPQPSHSQQLGMSCPTHDPEHPANDQPVQRHTGCSVLELELQEEVAAIRQRHQAAAAAAEASLYNRNPDSAYWEHRDSLPPNPALMHAQQVWAAAAAASSSGTDSSSTWCLGCTVAGAAGSQNQTTKHDHSTGAGSFLPSSGLRLQSSQVTTQQGGDLQSLAAQGCLQGTFLYCTAAGKQRLVAG